MLFDKMTRLKKIMWKGDQTNETEKAKRIMAINRWVCMNDTMQTNGWREYHDELMNIFNKFSSIQGIKIDEFEYRQGIVDGISMALNIPEKFKREASDAKRALESSGSKYGNV